MPSLIAFSGKQGDHIVIEESRDDANDKLSVTNASGSGLCQLTRVPGLQQRIEPGPVLINPQRVAYVWELGSDR